ncbi:MAG: hypothetical protein JO314_09780 [Acidobacteria bacterium]|nr:hypothetical protein [Acidobacteriota bacterium]
MRFLGLVASPLLSLVFASFCFSQDPLPVIKSTWSPAVQKAVKKDVGQTGPAKQILPEDTMISRTGRDFATDHPDNPSDQAPDGRRAAIERNEEEARQPDTKDVKGFTYSATVRNDSDKAVKVVFWEYKFTEKANPANVVRRQFLCSVDIKKGAQFDLSIFSTLGPTDTIDAKTLAASKEPLFNETVRVNSIEYSDGEVLQRHDWKAAEVKAAVDRITSKPWGKEPCRLLL